jgi:hypothetical protein
MTSLSPSDDGPEPAAAVSATIWDGLIDDAVPLAAADVGVQDQSDLILFCGPGSERFLRKRGLAICWPGFFLPLGWLLYRKMYPHSALVVLAPVLLGLFHAPTGVLRLLGLLVSAFGACGQALYLSRARRMVAEIRRDAPDDAVARETIERAGGTSVAGAVVGVLVTLAFLSFSYLKQR